MSSIAGLSVTRPVLTIVVSLLILLFGLIGMLRLPIREYPAVDPPTISVTTSYPGAAAETVQAQITEPIEEAINSVAGIVALNSSSREGASQISVEFSLDTDLDTAASDVRDQLSRATRNLPADADPPVLNKANADSAPIFGIALQSRTRSQLELGAYADSLRERLQTVPGIAGVDQPAEKRYAMRLWMDPLRLSAYGISPLDVSGAVARENVELPSGRIEGGAVELPVKTESRLNTPDDFNKMIVKRERDRVVRFSDIGYAELGPQYERGALKIGDTPIAGLYFRQQPGANQIDIVDELRQRLNQVLKDVPKDIEVRVAYDNTEYVRRSLLEVSETIFVAFVLVVLVVFAFLREWRSTLIPVLAIPVSVVGAFGIMAVAGFSINTLTLLGIVLAVGLVVDDAIVVLENIYSKIEGGMAPLRAAVDGTREIFAAVIATTITLVVVFLPLLFMGGLSGRLFREFGVTIAGAVLISALVALTLTPMLCSRLLRPHEKRGRLFERTEHFFSAFESLYARSLERFLRHRWLAFAVLSVSGMIVALLLHALPRELSPLEDRGRIWLRATAPEGTGYERMQSFMDGLARAAAERIPEAKLMMTQIPGTGNVAGAQGSVNSGFVRIFLNDREERRRSQQQIAADLQNLVRTYSDARVNVTQEASIGERRATSSGVQFVLQALNFEALRDRVPAFLEAARQSPVFSFVDSDLKFNKPEIRVTIDRTKALTLGLSMQNITRTLQASLSGSRIGYFILNGKQYDVIGQLTRDFRSRPSDLLNIPIIGAAGSQPLTLDNVVRFEENSAPPELYRYNRYNSATVSGTLAYGYTMADGIDAFQRIADASLDERFTTALTGAARDFVDSSSSLTYVFMLALVLIYLVLAAQFESFHGPLIILFTVPLALVGALASLWAFGQTLNIFSQIGLIMLIGLVTKNGILLVEFANQRRVAGAGPATAAHEAATARLRPILMTSLATVLGILPIALALGAGSESRMSMGIAVIGGLICGCGLTLYIIPSMYVLLSGRGAVPAAGLVAVGPADGT